MPRLRTRVYDRRYVYPRLSASRPLLLAMMRCRRHQFFTIPGAAEDIYYKKSEAIGVITHLRARASLLDRDAMSEAKRCHMRERNTVMRRVWMPAVFAEKCRAYAIEELFLKKRETLRERRYRRGICCSAVTGSARPRLVEGVPKYVHPRETFILRASLVLRCSSAAMMPATARCLHTHGISPVRLPPTPTAAFSTIRNSIL